jgi:glycosyltransferase involved in cell wall biosynthesis
MPKIREKYPNIELHIVGARPTAAIMALESKYVKIHANVPRFQPFLQNARVFLHPHSAATGIQNKLLEAMACGCPVVTTPTGNQGIYAKHGEHALISDNIDDLVDYTIQLLEDDELAMKLSDNARKLIVDTHSWAEVGRQIDSIIEELFNE